MKKAIAGIFLCGLAVLSTAASPAESPIRRGPRPGKPGAYGVGRQIPDLVLTDIAGTKHKLSDFSDRKAVVLAMTGTGCPLCLKYAPSLAMIERRYRDEEIAFVFINPNESESIERVQDAVDTHRLQGPDVRDEQMILPRVLGAETTTEVFVLDRARTLIYRGAVDDQYGFGYALEMPRNSFLTNALDAVLEGKTPETQATSSPGCELFYENAIETDAAVTYHNRISRIIQANCIDCHRDSGLAPIPLENFEQVKDYAGMIRSVIQRGIMPPWFAAPMTTNKQAEPHSLHWSNDRSLSVQEKNDLFAWVDSGAPEGDPADAPLPKSFSGEWLIGEPDAVFEFPKPLPVQATGAMPYKYVTVETDLLEDKWVQAIEVRPGKVEVVHHVIVSLQNDQKVNQVRNGLWAGYAPGNSTYVYPSGYARRLPQGAKLRFQMHYTPNGTAAEDRTRIGLIYAKEPPRHEVEMIGIANRRLRIPPGAENHQVVASLRLPYDVQILGFLPHMHLRGKAARYEMLTAGGTEILLDIPHYDFNWQLFYRLAEPQVLRQGETIRFTGWFDNSENNPANPDPGKAVRWGKQTEDEMHLGYVEYVIPDAKPEVGQSESVDAGSLGFGGKAIRPASLVKTLRQLDQNKDGKLEGSEVPTKYQRVFELLDADDDGVLTTKEVTAAIRRMRK